MFQPSLLMIESYLISVDSFTPIAPPRDYPPFKFRPIVLQTKWVFVLMMVYLAIGGGIAALLFTSGGDRTFSVSCENVHLVASYGPGLTATITVLLFRQTIRDVFRMKPFFAMADQKGKITKGASPAECIAGAFFPWTDLVLIPTSSLDWCRSLSDAPVSFLVAAKTVLLDTQQIGSDWIVTVRTGPAYFLIVSYTIMALVNLVIIVWAWSLSTGLKWDPVSIADYIALFARGNALGCFSDLEYSRVHGFGNAKKNRASSIMARRLRFRIGYWETKTQNPDGTKSRSVIYGIGALDTTPGNN